MPDQLTTTFGDTVTFTVTVAAVTPGLPAPTGTVTISQGSTVLGSGTLSGGQVTIPTSALPVGNDPIIATYGGDGNFNTNTSSTITETVDPVLVATSIAAVSPNPRNTAVSAVLVTFNEPVNLSELHDRRADADRQRRTQPDHQRRLARPRLGHDLPINGLAGLTAADGSYTLTVNAADLNDSTATPGTGSLSTSWLMDTTPPTSTVNPLPAPTTSTSFTVSVTGTDPNGSGGSTPSGVASYRDLRLDTDGGPFTLWRPSRPPVPRPRSRARPGTLRLLQRRDRQRRQRAAHARRRPSRPSRSCPR